MWAAAAAPTKSPHAAHGIPAGLPLGRLCCRPLRRSAAPHPLPRSYGTFLKRLQDPVIAEVEKRVASECWANRNFVLFAVLLLQAMGPAMLPLKA